MCTACKLPKSPVCAIVTLTFTAAVVCAEEIGEAAEKLEGDESASRLAAQHELASCAFCRPAYALPLLAKLATLK